MLKYLALIAAGYLAYRWLIRPKKQSRNSPQKPREMGQIEDEMIQDPHCGAYFPKSQGVPAKVDGKRLLFCSEKCRDDYLARYQTHGKE